MSRRERSEERCPVCDREFDSVSEHAGGLMVNLLDNERYRRVCFDPTLADDEARVRFYHHTHDQAGTQPKPAGEHEGPVETGE